MNFFKIIKNDIKNILSNKMLAITLVVVMLLPLLYGGLYLAALWDPYGQTESIPVAVVNLDQGTEKEDIFYRFGGDLEDALKENDDIGWQFVETVKEAEEGLMGDKYYAMLVIPKNFSQQVMDVEHGKLKKPKVVFKANKKKNYIVGLIADKAAGAVEKGIKEKTGAKFTEIIVDNLETLRDGLETAADGTYTMKDGITELKDKIPSLDSALEKIEDGSSTLEEKLGDAEDGGNKLKEGIGTLKSKVPDLLDGIDRLHNATVNLNENVKDAYDGSTRLRDGALGLNDKLPDLSDGVDSIFEGSTALKEGIGQVDDKMPDLIDGVEKLRDGARDLRNGISKVTKGIEDKLGDEKDKKKKSEEEESKKPKKKLDEQVVNKLVEGIAPAIPIAKGKIPQLAGGLEQVNGGLKVLESMASSPEQKQIMQGLINNIKRDKEDMNSLLEAFKLIETGEDGKVKYGLLQLSKLLVRKDIDGEYCVVKNTIDDLNSVEKLVKQIASSYGVDIEVVPVEKLPPQLIPLKQLYMGANQISTELNKIYSNPKLKVLKDGLNMYQVMYQMESYDRTIIPKLTGIIDGLNALYEGSNKLYNGLDTLYDKTIGLQDGIGLLYNGSKDLNNGADKFQGIVPVLVGGVSQLTDGTRDLSDGLFKLEKGTGTLSDKVKELNEKVPDMQDGINLLYDGTFDLTDGLSKLKEASGKLNNGVSNLKNKMPDLQDGVDKLYEGSSTLNSSLAKGGEKISDRLVRSSKLMGDFVANPINLDDTPIFDVDKYGIGLAPNFVSLGLWMGALMMFFLITDKVQEEKVGKSRNASIMLGKYLLCGAIGTIQAILLSLAVIKLGLNPVSNLTYIGFNIFLSWVFVAVAITLVFLLGDVGRLLLVIILLLQLTSSGGTFPRELLPRFFQVVNPYLPFTYSISGMREVILGPNPAVLRRDIAVLTAVLVGSLAIGIAFKGRMDDFKRKKSQEKNQIIDEGSSISH